MAVGAIFDLLTVPTPALASEELELSRDIVHEDARCYCSQCSNGTETSVGGGR